MASLGAKHPVPLPITSTSGSTCFNGRYSPSYRSDHHHMRRHCSANPTGNLFPSLEEGLVGRMDDLAKHAPGSTHPGLHLKHDMMYGAHPSMASTHPSQHVDTLEILEPICPSSLQSLTATDATGTQIHSSIYTHHHPVNAIMGSQHHPLGAHQITQMSSLHDSDPRELEAFAERFKQKRIKLGVTQADVGKALANLKLPGVGSLSQSTICRFESLTLSHNNMVALRPILNAWLEAAEAQARGKRRDGDMPCFLPSGEKKRKRTSIAAPEKRSLEAYFAVQQRPSGEKIAAIAEKLDLKKNVVRVWFCNQRQKQKRMKYSACQH